MPQRGLGSASAAVRPYFLDRTDARAGCLRLRAPSWGSQVRGMNLKLTAVTGTSFIFGRRVFEWHGYEPTREATMPAFATSWRREG
jgi:hypothetical protein